MFFLLPNSDIFLLVRRQLLKNVSVPIILFLLLFFPPRTDVGQQVVKLRHRETEVPLKASVLQMPVLQ